ncbi:MAG: hypothetical protein IPJ34_00530 [Myxococcales bacterium]|nr:hypothetical protein [Myxococcales bacterium]
MISASWRGERAVGAHRVDRDRTERVTHGLLGALGRGLGAGEREQRHRAERAAEPERQEEAEPEAHRHEEDHGRGGEQQRGHEGADGGDVAEQPVATGAGGLGERAGLAAGALDGLFDRDPGLVAGGADE